ncbi:MAG: hypothetical protein L0338_11095 [Acidobacteria bacterium]|nr:hypothetical protein [Acidobacteriota bacterium]
MVFGTQWFTGNRVDPIERGISSVFASVGFGALALEGFAARAAFTPAYVPFAAEGIAPQYCGIKLPEMRPEMQSLRRVLEA